MTTRTNDPPGSASGPSALAQALAGSLMDYPQPYILDALQRCEDHFEPILATLGEVGSP